MDFGVNQKGEPIHDPSYLLRLRDGFAGLACVMTRLRSECPWDRVQTPETLKKYVLEEAYEVIEAIETGNWDELKDELGDFLLQVVFQAEIQAGLGRFTLADVIEAIVAKLVRRHPHVFAEVQLSRPEEVEMNWDHLKTLEKPHRNSVMDGLPKGLPALLESYKISKKAAKVGFDWPNPGQVILKIEEELAEVEAALAQKQPEKVTEELGDLLFAVSNLARKCGGEPEEIMRQANRKFAARFRAMEALARDRGLTLADLNLEDQECLWQEVKRGPGSHEKDVL